MIANKTSTSTSSTVQFVALRAQYDELRTEIDRAIASVLERSAYIGGAELTELERWFAAAWGVPHAIGVSSGTRAIELVLRALGVGPGDEVVAPAHTFVATVSAIAAAGARPVLVDVEEDSGNLDPDRLAAALTSRTKAIMPVHLYGRPAPMAAILEVAGARGVPVIEDAAQAHGARYRGVAVGALGVAGCFSFYPTKNLGAFGDGGLVTTRDDRLAAAVRLLRDHGRTSKYEHSVFGYTARLDNLQAAVLRVQADRLDDWNARRRQAAAWYREALPAFVRTPSEDPQAPSVYHLFVARVAGRDAFRAHLEAHGVPTAVHYPVPLHLQPACRDLGYKAGDFPVAERLAADIVSLPMHPFLTRDQVQYVAGVASGFQP
jgi:dTDP-4-amino-4,6-dideoxygalactose transaminase